METHLFKRALGNLRAITVSLMAIGIVASLVTASSLPYSMLNKADADFSPTVMMETEPGSSSEHEARVPKSASEFYPVISERWGQNPTIDSEEEASYVAGFDVKFPRIESDYELQLAAIDQVQNDTRYYVWLFYSPTPITDKMTVNQFWEQGGITINYHENMLSVLNDDGTTSTSYTDMAAMVESSIQSGLVAYEGDINGHRMVAIEDKHREFQGFAIHDPAQVDFIAGNTYVTLQGYKTLPDLVRIAESMSFDAGHEHH